MSNPYRESPEPEPILRQLYRRTRAGFFPAFVLVFSIAWLAFCELVVIVLAMRLWAWLVGVNCP